MKKTILSMACISLLAANVAMAQPSGFITIYNASKDDVTARLNASAFATFTLAANEKMNIPYSALQSVCSDHPAHCSASFYVNNRPAGRATINVNTGELVQMHIAKKVRVSQPNNVLRTVVMQ